VLCSLQLWAMEGPLCHDVFIECCGFVASHFQPSLFIVLLGNSSLYFRGFYMGPASLKTSPPLEVLFCEKKSTSPFS
jgi:hypothetical protein